MSIYSETIYSDDYINISIIDNAIIVESLVNTLVLSSSWLNGGIQKNIKYMVNQSLLPEDYDVIEKLAIGTFQQEKFKNLNLDSKLSVGLITSANMDNYGLSIKEYDELKVITIATAGADKNAVKAGDNASFYEYNNNYKIIGGTINIITFINANLDEGALATASITLTEAKTSVLQDLKIESQYSNNVATGTGTDGFCIISNKSSKNYLENAGKHSKLGELIAKSVQDAVYFALYSQTGMCNDYQNTVLSRLSRFNIYFDDFYECCDVDICEYSKVFYEFNNSSKYISAVSSIINLIDEVQSNLLTFSCVSESIILIINTFLKQENDIIEFESITQIMEFLINSINNYLVGEIKLESN